MRLLDLIAQARVEPIRTDDGRLVPGAERFKDAIRACPVRFVLTDDLTCCATQLAYAGGDRLASCLDLVRVPAQSLWVEWADGPRQDVLRTITLLSDQSQTLAQRAGALFTTEAGGRNGEIRTFWSTHNQYAYVSPLVVQFDFDHVTPQGELAKQVTSCGEVRVTAPSVLGLDGLLEHVKFRYDTEWSLYYQERCVTDEMRRDVLRANLRACAFDPPMLFAFFLMLCARDALPRRAVLVDRLNRSRSRTGRPPLLEHIDVSAPLFAEGLTQVSAGAGRNEPDRRSPRLHHVCGHIVRRGTSVFWRNAHLRGSARLGRVRSRTVELSYAHNSAVPSFVRAGV